LGISSRTPEAGGFCVETGGGFGAGSDGSLMSGGLLFLTELFEVTVPDMVNSLF
jgi:hypothetical protein